MRDFNAGGDVNVGGDLNITDNSSQLKPLALCTNDELLEERLCRKKVLGQERKAKWKRLALALVFIAVVLCAVSLFIYLKGDTTLASFVLGGGGAAASFASVKALERPTEFEERQIIALKEIRMILRERGVER